MNATKGTFLVIYPSLKLYLILFLGITFVLAATWIVIGMNFELPSDTKAVIFGPLYGGIIAFAGSIYSLSYRPAISLGATRPQYINIFSQSAMLFVVISIFVLNLIYFVWIQLFNQDVSSAIFYHPGMHIAPYHFATYLWIDYMIGFCLLGVTFVITSFWFKYGFLWVVISATSLLMVLTFLFMFSHFGSWLYNMNGLGVFSAIGGIGGILLVLNYFFMRHAPLSYKSRNG